MSDNSTIIDGYVFAIGNGVINPPRRSTERFTSSTMANAGIQIKPSNSVVSELRLVKFVPPDFSQVTVEYHVAQIGKQVFLEHGGVKYYQFPLSVRFMVLDVIIEESRAIAHASGFAGGQAFSFSPAWMVRSRWLLQQTEA